MRHVLKSAPRYFDAIFRGVRTHELRRNDRNYQVGDVLELHEYDDGYYTCRRCTVEVTSMTSAKQACAASKEALHPDFCILSVRLVKEE